ncbi:MAG: cytochrome b/b6 domain-containing protein [bacterium]
MSIKQVKVFSRFERFWHWTQMLLIVFLLISGFGIHGFHELLSFQQLVIAHVLAALSLIVLWIFAIFWHLTTGNWKHYIPTSNGLGAVAKYYAWGIFKGENHPFKKRFWHKHNPLQALSYLVLKLIIFPVIWVTGLSYLLYGLWSDAGSTNLTLSWIANAHTLTAFVILAFILIHVYLLTTGHSFKKHVMPMISGYDEIDLSDSELKYLKEDEPERLK